MHLHLAVDDVGGVAVERRHRRQREPAILVVIAEDELARCELAPAACGVRQAVAGSRLGAAALQRRLGDAVFEAEMVSALGQGLRALLMDDRDGFVEARLQFGASPLQRLLVDAVERDEDVRLPRTEPRLPVLGRALADVAEQMGARGHALAEVLGERRQQRGVDAERDEPRVSERQVQGGLGRTVRPPRLSRRHLVDQSPQPGAAARGVGDAHEHVGTHRVGVPADEVALEVLEVQLGGGLAPARQQAWTLARVVSADAHCPPAISVRNSAWSSASESSPDREISSPKPAWTRSASWIRGTVSNGHGETR